MFREDVCFCRNDAEQQPYVRSCQQSESQKEETQHRPHLCSEGLRSAMSLDPAAAPSVSLDTELWESEY